jgi:hypothetical protein
VRCTTGAGAGAGTVLVVLEKDMQPAPSVMAARTIPEVRTSSCKFPSKDHFAVAKRIL